MGTSNQIAIGRKMIYTNLAEVLEDSQTMECIDYENRNETIAKPLFVLYKIHI